MHRFVWESVWALEPFSGLDWDWASSSMAFERSRRRDSLDAFRRREDRENSIDSRIKNKKKKKSTLHYRLLLL
jgi:hypothetical protein